VTSLLQAAQGAQAAGDLLLATLVDKAEVITKIGCQTRPADRLRRCQALLDIRNRFRLGEAE
jgi:hypothetical protein